MLVTTTLLLIFLVALSLPIAAVLGFLGLSLSYFFSDFPLYRAVGEIFWQHGIDPVLAAIPMFILLGEILLRSGMADRMYGSMSLWLSWLPGGLMHANIATSALFAATSGSSIATAATVGTAAMPQIARRKYNERLFLGSLAAGGTLGILIPPSTNMIIYGFLTDTSVPQLFLGGMIPGLILTLLYMFVILICCLVRPEWGGVRDVVSLDQRLRSLIDLLPPVILFTIILGTIYAGLATPTEAAAIGTVAALAMVAMKRLFNMNMLREAMKGTMRTATMMIFITLAAFFLNFVLASLGMVQTVTDFILGLGWAPLNTMMFIIGVYLVMGMFMDPLAMVVLTVPTITPVVVALGYDPVWFGVLIVLLTEAAQLTPPMGMICFVIQGLRRAGELKDIFIGIIPFIFMVGVMIVLIVAFPEIVLWLPGQMYR